MQEKIKSLQYLLTDLKGIFHEPERALVAFLARPARSAPYLLWTMHLPLLLLGPIAGLLCPLCWLRGGHFSIKKLFVPSLVAAALLLVTVTTDRLIEHSRIRGLMDSDRPLMKNIGLFLTLPVSAALVFFLLHPAVGYLMLIASWIYFMFLTLGFHARYREMTITRVVIYYLSAAITLLFGLVVVLALLNVWKSFEILRSLL